MSETPDDLDKKGFTWDLVDYNQDKVGLKFNFENYKFISASGEPDTMKISFNNTEAWMIPANSKGRMAIPNGFISTFKIRPQGNDLMSD